MSDLPLGWAETPLGNACTVIRGITFPASEKTFVAAASTICCLRTTNVQRELEWSDIYFVPKAYVKREDQFVRPGDVLMSMANSFELVGKVSLAKHVPIPAAFGAFLSAVRPKVGVDSRFMFYLLRTQDVQEQLRSGSSQTVNIANISVARLSNIMVPIAPPGEQERIADKLDTLLARIDACRDRLKQLPAMISRLRQSALSSAVNGRLTTDWQTANSRGREVPEATTLDDLLAAGWRFPRADEVCAKVQSGGTPTAGFVASAGVPFLKVYNLVNQTVDFNYREQYIAEDVHRGPMRKSITKPGDVLMNIVGPPLGKVAVVPDSSQEWNINQAIALFRAGDEVLGEWLYYVLCEGAAVRGVMPDTRGSVGQINISLSQCRAFTLPVPPLDEQKELVIRLRRLMGLADRLDERVRIASRAVGRLDKATLAKAFRGELVAQNPCDEPAATMLARLAASKAPQKNGKHVRGAA